MESRVITLDAATTLHIPARFAVVLDAMEKGSIRMTTKKKAGKCTTHFMCDCWKYKTERMESALKVIRTWADFDRGMGYRTALTPEHVVALCDQALGGIK